MNMHSVEIMEHANIHFPYQMEVASFVNYKPLIKHFRNGKHNVSSIYFPKFKFSYTTSKIVYLSNEINALTELLNIRYDFDLIQEIISKYKALFIMARFYINSEATVPIRSDEMVNALRSKATECDNICYEYDYIETDNSLFDAKYGFCSKIY